MEKCRPNFLFIFMDDMGWKDLGCTGSTFYETPNIDRLCREGMQFANAYASCPVCSPSRASFLTGQHPARHGVTDWIDMSGKYHPLKGKVIEAPYLKHLPADAVTVAQILQEAGYATWHVGKWHLGSEEYYPEKFGFDINIGGCDWGNPYNGYFAPYGIHTLPEKEEGEYLTDRITDEAIRLIREKDDRPFFMNLCHYAVHTPIQAKPEDIRRFEEKARSLGLTEQNAIIEGEEMHTLDKKGVHVKRRILQSDPVYAAMIWNLDQNIGRLLAALDETGEADNTVVIFSSDNGGLSTAEGSPTCNLPAREGKGWMQEGGVRVPLIVKYPGEIKENSRCDIPVVTMDFFPTFLELAGLPERKELHKDGVSIVPLLKGKAIEPRPLFWHYPHYGNQGGVPGASVIDGHFKLIESLEDGTVQLYDLSVDFSEQYDLSNEYPEKAIHMQKMLHEWQKDIGAIMPVKNKM